MSWWKTPVLMQRFEGVLIGECPDSGGIVPWVSTVEPNLTLCVTTVAVSDSRERDNICKLIHMPAQSGNTDILKRMRRGFVV